MILLLASNIGGIKKDNNKTIATPFFEKNFFLDNMKKSIKENRKFVMIASDPDNYEKNDYFLNIDIKALEMSGITFKQYYVLDGRNKKNVANVLDGSDLIFICGGNTLKQNIFFNEINLKKYIKKINSVVVGISAGAINSAKSVYNSPECDEDLTKSAYLNGLGLTYINIEPHFHLNIDDNHDTKLQRNEILKESYNRAIIAISDGAYVLEKNNICLLYGEGYLIRNGIIKKICDNGKYINLLDYL